jgi:hypothetical protein
MNIRTTYDPPPIPIRSFDWSAIDEDTYDPDPECRASRLIGWGATENEAIAELETVIEENAP